MAAPLYTRKQQALTNKLYNRSTVPHCEHCGRPEPETYDGYTCCCNELVCDGLSLQLWQSDHAAPVRACCGFYADKAFEARDGKLPENSYLSCRENIEYRRR